MNTDAAGATPEPGTTPEPDGAGDDKGGALAALLAAGAEDMSEPENDGEGRGKSKSAKRSRPGSEERQQDDGESADYSNCRPLHTRPNALLAAAAASADAEGAEAPLGSDWRKQHVLYGNDNHYMFFRLHRHVYDRLAAAQRCARDKNQPQFRQTGDEHRKEPDPQVGGRLAGEWPSGCLQSLWWTAEVYGCIGIYHCCSDCSIPLKLLRPRGHLHLPNGCPADGTVSMCSLC